MSDINQLNLIATPSTGDLLPIFSSANGDTQKISLTQFVAFLLTQITSVSGYITQYASPNTTGFSVTINSQTTNTWLLLTPTAGFASATIVLPLSSTTPDQTQITTSCTQAITALTINGNGASVNGAPVSLTANQSFTLKFDGVSKNWYLFT